MADAPVAGTAAGPAGASSRPAAPRPWADHAAAPFISIRQVTRRFGPGPPAVDRVSLDIWQGELFCLLGGSGSGKTTLLRMLSGFEQADGGTIHIDGRDMTGVPPWRRPVNMMFQSYALFPHMSVAGNIAFGLRRDGVPRDQIRRRVAEMLALVKMEGYGSRRPHQLSGGQRQRVALARALVKQPKVLLLDEPLAALDKKLREETQFELIRIQESLGITFVVVTHDQEEAMTLASRIGVMDQGQLVQVGEPREIYEFPANRFIAQFIGSVTLFEGQVVEDAEDHVVIRSAEAGTDIFIGHGISGAPGQRVWVALRPEKLRLSRTPPAADTHRIGPPGTNIATGTVEEIAYLGDLSIYRVMLDSGRLIQVSRLNLDRHGEDADGDTAITWDERVHVSWGPASAVVLTQ